MSVALSTDQMSWSEVELRLFEGRTPQTPPTGLFSLPDGELVTLTLDARRRALAADPLAGKVRWRITRGGR
jgi:hypothetical protein